MGGRIILGDSDVTAVETRRIADRRRATAGRAHSRRQHRVDGAAHDLEPRSSGSRASTSSTCRRSSTTSRSASRRKLDYQWTYFGGDEIFSRVTAPEAFLTTTAPPGKSGLCVEFTCREGDERWQNPERYTQPIIADLVRTGAIDSAEDVERVHIERVPFTYPIYKLNYLGELTAQPARARARTRTCCWPAAAAASGTTTWTTRSARA